MLSIRLQSVRKPSKDYLIEDLGFPKGLNYQNLLQRYMNPMVGSSANTAINPRIA